MKRNRKADPVGEVIKDYLAENPRVLLRLLPEECLPDGDQESVSIEVERIDLEAENRQSRSFPYERRDPLLRFLQEQPEILLKLLREELQLKLPPYTEVKVEEQDLDHIEPQAPTHTVLLCQAAGKTVYGIVLDVVRKVHKDKTYRWPLNTVLLHTRIDAFVSLVVLAAGADAEAFARTPNYWQERTPFTPIVIGPSLFLKDSPGSAATDPARATFAALLGSLHASG